MKKVMKNKKFIMIFAMVLMVSLVVGMGAMTYAKYVTSYNTPAQSATAAKWGFVVTADASNLFGNQYKEPASGGDTYATVNEEGNVVVKGTADAKVVAPGTMGYLTINVNGSAEVMAKLSVTLDITENIGNGTYVPVQWALVAGNATPADDAWVTDLETLTTAADYTPGTTVASSYKLYWRWAFSTSTDNDKLDTVIGAKAAGKNYTEVNAMTGLNLTSEAFDAYKTTVSFTATITVEQIQKPTT